ncbi:DUF4124 domain-containing protein [Stenotrophomonas sp. ATCM1_4]|uniref:DUF4124 domain-containing protein n=1 Tax=Stenotrophomonas sp. ATCM1_4 TaxID=2259330 RepID=UPI00104F387C|nr:DUF4124 domain-containing protein [Stenotrophomonas sp. ATCM1_4]TDB29399.1 DUF4124 domain-containing protein [Stenotrophomonas sp. ATCM1_4]
MRACLLLLVPLLLLPSPAWAVDPPPSDGVRIYRCVGANGAISLQDAPCTQAHRQQVLDMVRPKDPPPRPASPTPPPAPVVEREVRVVTVQPPQPMYECVTAEGERYTSDSADGNPRWVPTWTYGYLPHGHGPRPPGGHPHPGGIPARPGVIIPGGSVLVRDSCHALPQQEVCARLRDSRWDLVRRYNSALQSERQRLVREQRGIEARLNQDCGGW